MFWNKKDKQMEEVKDVIKENVSELIRKFDEQDRKLIIVLDELKHKLDLFELTLHQHEKRITNLENK